MFAWVFAWVWGVGVDGREGVGVACLCLGGRLQEIACRGQAFQPRVRPLETALRTPSLLALPPRPPSSPSPIPGCLGSGSLTKRTFPAWLATPAVASALHVGAVPYAVMNQTVEDRLIKDWCVGVVPWLQTLMEHYDVLIYSGLLGARGGVACACLPRGHAPHYSPLLPARHSQWASSSRSA